jgi:hypothetical protein
MKIVSPFKDYYDFVAGYDTDPRKVFVRGGESYSEGEDKLPGHSIFSIVQQHTHLVKWPAKNRAWFQGLVLFCNKAYPYIQDLVSSTVYWSYADVPEEEQQAIDAAMDAARYGYERLFLHFRTVERTATRFGLNETDRYEQQGTFNTDYKAPIVFSAYDAVRGKPRYWVNGKLGDLEFRKIVPPQEAYTTIYNFLPSDAPPLPTDPTDMQRFENKGFDKKTSFRGKAS